MPAPSKYEPLRRHLEASGRDRVAMTFAEIERVVGHALPPSARKHRPWWSNNAANSVVTRAWRGAGYRTARVDMEAEALVFEKVSDPVDERANVSARHPIFGFMRGTVTLAPGTDLTAPADPEWAEPAE